MIIVTGANGFIGSAMVWQLNEAGLTDIVCVDSVSLQDRPLNLKKRKYSKFLLKDQLWDFLNQADIQNKVQWIIHMGANSSTTETNWDHLYENNTLYTERLFKWCTEHKKNLIYASSAATYGDGKNGYDDEFDSNKLESLNLYGKSKLIFDQWALKQSTTPPNWYGLKFFNVYGPNENHKGSMSSVVYKAFHQIKETSHLKLFKSHNPNYKDGEQMRDFVYVKDVTHWMSELMTKTPKSGIYNMGFGRARTWLDLAKSTFSSMKKELNIQFIEVPENIRNQYQYFTEAKMDKWIRNGLSSPQWPIEKGVKDYIEKYLSNEDTYL